MSRSRNLIEILLLFFMTIVMHYVVMHLYQYMVMYQLNLEWLSRYISIEILDTPEGILMFLDQTSVIPIVLSWILALFISVAVIKLSKLSLFNNGIRRFIIIRPVNAVLSVLIGMGLFFTVYAMAHLLSVFYGLTYVTEPVLYFENPFWTLIAVGLVIPLLEEVLFRGVLLNHMLRVFRPMIAVITMAILFSLSHLNPLQSVLLLPLGIVAGIAVIQTKALLTAIIIHMVFNLLNGYMHIHLSFHSLFQGPIRSHLLMVVLGILMVFIGLYQLSPEVVPVDSVIHDRRF